MCHPLITAGLSRRVWDCQRTFTFTVGCRLCAAVRPPPPISEVGKRHANASNGPPCQSHRRAQRTLGRAEAYPGSQSTPSLLDRLSPDKFLPVALLAGMALG